MNNFASIKFCTCAASRKRWLMVLAFLLVIVLLSWNWASVDADVLAKATHTPFPSITPTLLPSEILENYQQTNGIVLVGVMIVLIVVGGTFAIMRRKA